MIRIWYKKDSGLLCNRYPNDLKQEEGDPFIEVTNDEFNESLVTETGKVWKVIGGKLQNVDDDSDAGKKERERLSRQARISELENWFRVYDNQCAQYLRATRRNEAISLHIGEKTYVSIDEMDREADEKAEELSKLREGKDEAAGTAEATSEEKTETVKSEVRYL